VIVGLQVFPQILHETYDGNNVTTAVDYTTEIGNSIDFAASLDASYKLKLSDTDSVTIGVGTIFDTGYNAGLVIATKTAGLVTVTQDQYKPYVVADPVVNPEDKLGWATMPFGAKVGVVMSGLTANVAA